MDQGCQVLIFKCGTSDFKWGTVGIQFFLKWGTSLGYSIFFSMERISLEKLPEIPFLLNNNIMFHCSLLDFEFIEYFSQ